MELENILLSDQNEITVCPSGSFRACLRHWLPLESLRLVSFPCIAHALEQFSR